MKPDLEGLIRNLKIPQLELLQLMANSDKPVATSHEIRTTTSTASYDLGALITPLRRHKINGEPLIVKAGEDVNDGTRWQLNPKLFDRDELKILLASMEF